MKNEWITANTTQLPVTYYVLKVQERLTDMLESAHDEKAKVKKYSKELYDRSATRITASVSSFSNIIMLTAWTAASIN